MPRPDNRAQARPPIDPAASYDVYLQTLFGIIGADLPPKAREALLAAGEAAEGGSYPRRVADAVRQSLSQHFAATPTTTCCYARSRPPSRSRTTSNVSISPRNSPGA